MRSCKENHSQGGDLFPVKTLWNLTGEVLSNSSAPNCVAGTNRKTPHPSSFSGSLCGASDSHQIPIRMCLQPIAAVVLLFCSLINYALHSNGHYTDSCCLIFFFLTMSVSLMHVFASLYRRLLGFNEKLSPITEYRVQRSYNRSAIEMTCRSNRISIVFLPFSESEIILII